MKNLIPIVLVAGGAAFLLSSGSKKTSASLIKKPSNRTGTPKIEEMKKNEENIKKYFICPPIPLSSVDLITNDLSEKLINQIFDQQYAIHIPSEIAEEAYYFSYSYILSNKKPIASPHAADAVTQEVLKQIMPDVMWNEGLTPYNFESPFPWVWKSVNLIAWIASQNLTEKGLIPKG